MKRHSERKEFHTPVKKSRSIPAISPLKSGLFSESDLKSTSLSGISIKYTLNISHIYGPQQPELLQYGSESILAKKADVTSCNLEIIGGKIYRAILNHLLVDSVLSSKVFKLTSQTGEDWVGIALEDNFKDLYKHYVESGYAANNEAISSLNSASKGYYYTHLPDNLKKIVTLISVIRWLCCDDDMHPGNIMYNGEKALMIDSGRVGRLKYESSANAFQSLLWALSFHQKTTISYDVKQTILDAAKLILDNKEELYELIQSVIIDSTPTNENSSNNLLEVKRLSLNTQKLPKYPFSSSPEYIEQNMLGTWLCNNIKSNFQHLRYIYNSMTMPSNLIIERVNAAHIKALEKVQVNQLMLECSNQNINHALQQTPATACL